MNSSYLKKVGGILVMIFAFCSMAEAGGASKAYKMSVTIPARTYVSAKAEVTPKIKKEWMQVAMEKGVRDNKVVMVKTAVVK
jgi:hypothetical protein